MTRGTARQLALLATLATLGLSAPCRAGDPADSPISATAPAAAPARDSRPLGPPSRSGEASSARTGVGTPGTGSLRTLGALAGVLALIFISAALFRRYVARKHTLAGTLGPAGRAPAGILEIIARYPLGRGNTLVLLRLDRRLLLLSQSLGAGGRGLLRTGAAAMTPLCEITDAEEVAAILAKARDDEGESLAARFQSLLGGLSTTGDAPDAAPETTAPKDEVPAAVTQRPRPEVVVRAGSWRAPARGGTA